MLAQLLKSVARVKARHHEMRILNEIKWKWDENEIEWDSNEMNGGLCIFMVDTVNFICNSFFILPFQFNPTLCSQFSLSSF